MTIVVLLFLAGIWGVVLYGYFKDRLADARPADSIGSFRHQLSVLQRTGPTTTSFPARSTTSVTGVATVAGVGAGPVGIAGGRRRRVSAAKRRRDVLFGLLAVMGGSLLLSFVPGLGTLRVFHLLADLLFVAYIGLLIRQRNVRAEREMKLRFLPSPAAAEPALLLRRTGN